MRLTTSIWALGALALTACGGGEAEAPAEEMSAPAPAEMMAEADAPEVDLIAAAVAHPDRPADDLENDARRLPEETLRFSGIKPGMTVFELEAGGGYFTEMIARAVGPDGTVYMQNPKSFDGFLGDALETRLGGERLPNVISTRTNFDELDAEDASVDVVTWFQGPHELWFEVNGESLGDPDMTFAEIARVLKSGGAFVAIDHSAEEGAGPEVGGTLHRIGEALITQYAEDAGLVLEASSDMFANPDDPLTTSVFDPAIRGKTDQFVLRFTKP